MKSQKVVIVTKDLQGRGGVVNYFRLFFEKFNSNFFEIEHFTIGSRPKDNHRRLQRKFQYLREFLSDSRKFIKLIRNDKRIFLVQVNPSLIPIPLIRDGIIILLSKFYGRKVLVFFRGWDPDVERRIRSNFLTRKIFSRFYSQGDHLLVLASQFSDSLVEMGFDQKKISISRTMFDGDNIHKHEPNREDPIKFLFVSRIQKEKGVFEIVAAISILKKRWLNVHVEFYGHYASGSIGDDLRAYVSELKVENQCHFHGYVDGEDKYKAYSAGDVFLLPSYHEGCPNSVIEAMASGCCVISTNVGALRDIIIDGQNGKIVQIKDDIDLANKMEWACNNVHLVRQIGRNNMKYAFNSFESEIITGQIERIYRKLVTS